MMTEQRQAERRGRAVTWPYLCRAILLGKGISLAGTLPCFPRSVLPPRGRAVLEKDVLPMCLCIQALAESQLALLGVFCLWTWTRKDGLGRGEGWQEVPEFTQKCPCCVIYPQTSRPSPTPVSALTCWFSALSGQRGHLPCSLSLHTSSGPHWRLILQQC